MGVESVNNTSIQLTEVENELYDRQIRLWGLESQMRLRTSKILISGITGVGAEVTKNIILSGVHSVKLHDEKLVSEDDICSQFLVSRDSVGVNRAIASMERARQLNPMVEISTDTEPLEKKGEQFFAQFDVVVICGAQEKELIRIDNICRAKNVYFFCGDVWGMFGYCCAELQKFSFYDEIIKHKLISAPNQKTKTELVTTTVQKELNFPPLEEVFNFDFNKKSYLKSVKRSGPAFIVLRILLKFRETFSRDPSYKTREEDIVQLQTIRNEFSSEDVVPSAWFNNVFCEISPSTAVVGGVLAQELIKVISKKGSPIYNIFLFNPENCNGYIDHISEESYSN